ncbi:MAG: putative bifunctional diguanylate cyclase/phosphodiesterase [Bacillota bacterium]
MSAFEGAELLQELSAAAGADQLSKAFRHMVLGVSLSTGSAFFTSLVTHLTQALQVDYAWVGALVDGEPPMIQVVAGKNMEATIYPLSGSPCEQALAGAPCLFTDRVAELFPADHGLVRLQMRGYAGMPLLDSTGRPIGLIAVGSRSPLPNVQLVHAVTQVFASRAAAELERRQYEQQLLHQATHDSLTQLPNRSYFLRDLQAALSSTSAGEDTLAVMFVDLDNFKVVNDSLGHEVGDRLLIDVAARLRRSVPESVLLARLGGDEFALVVRQPEARSGAERIARALLRAFQEPFFLGSHPIHIQTSIGIAQNCQDCCTPSLIMRHADLALYRAKESGKGAYAIFDRQMAEEVNRRLQVEQEMRRGLEAAEFLVHYQPLVDLASGTTRGLEALVRWNHPERGLLRPHEFIQLAEESRLILPLGDQVLRIACRDMQRWHAEGLLPSGSYLSVNISPRQILSYQLLKTLPEALAESGLPPGMLQLEITESVLMGDQEVARAVMAEIRALGVRFALDDFGTGYSSLSYLQRFSIDTLKIDRSFVAGIGAEPYSEAITRSIVAMGRHLSLAVTAEGVESEGQARFLLEAGCPEGQGYLYARPLPPEQVADWLREHRP